MNSLLPKAVLSGVLPVVIASSAVTNEGWRGKSTRLINEVNRTVDYQYFTSSEKSNLHLWEGQNVILLTKSGNYSKIKMNRLLGDLDKAYLYYAQMAQKYPKPHWKVDDKLTIAEVRDTGKDSAARGFLGRTGIEVDSETMIEALDRHFSKGEVHHVFLWEFGRNFWFGLENIGNGHDLDDVAGAYTMAMKTMAAEEAGIAVDIRTRKDAEDLERIAQYYLQYDGAGRGPWEILDQINNPADRRKFLAAMIIRAYKTGGASTYDIAHDTVKVIDPADPRLLYAAYPVVTTPLNDQGGLSAVSGGDLSPQL